MNLPWQPRPPSSPLLRCLSKQAIQQPYTAGLLRQGRRLALVGDGVLWCQTRVQSITLLLISLTLQTWHKTPCPGSRMIQPPSHLLNGHAAKQTTLFSWRKKTIAANSATGRPQNSVLYAASHACNRSD